MINEALTPFLLLSLVLTVVTHLSGQVPPEAILIDEFGPYPCDGFRGRIDGLLSELRDNPDADGIVVHIGRGNDEFRGLIREEMIRNHVAFRGFDASRISYTHQAGDGFMTQFLRVPSAQAGASTFQNNYVLSSILTPVTIEDYDYDDLCPPLNYLHFFATILEQNPKAKVTILVRGQNLRTARRKEREVSTYLQKERRLTPSRIATFLTVKSDFEYGMDPVVEYRFIP